MKRKIEDLNQTIFELHETFQIGRILHACKDSRTMDMMLDIQINCLRIHGRSLESKKKGHFNDSS